MDWFLQDNGLCHERVKRDSSPKFFLEVTKGIDLLQQNVYGQVYSYKYCRLLPKEESITDFFVGVMSPPNISIVTALFNIRHEYSLQTTTLPYCVTDDFTRAFRNNCPKNFGKLSEKRMYWSPLLLQLYKYSIQPTTGLLYRCILEILRKKRMF